LALTTSTTTTLDVASTTMPRLALAGLVFALPGALGPQPPGEGDRLLDQVAPWRRMLALGLTT
jgi:hypothetical protein